MKDQLVTQAATNTTHYKYKRMISTPSVGFEPANPVIGEPQNCALKRTANGIGYIDIINDMK